MVVDFVKNYWNSINWQTFTITLVVFLPTAALVTNWIFEKVAQHDRNALRAEKDAHENTKKELNDARGQFLRMKAHKDRLELENAELVNINDANNKKLSGPKLTDEEARVLKALSEDRMHDLRHSPYRGGPRSNLKKMSDQRIQFAIDRLLELRFVAYGTAGAFATKEGRRWLDQNGLLE